MLDQTDNVSESTIEAPEAVEASSETPQEPKAPEVDFSALLRKHGGGSEKEEAPKQEEAPEAKAPEQQAPAKDEQPAEVSAKDRQRALTALRRGKASQEMVDSLDTPETMKMALELADWQSEKDRLFSQAGQRASEQTGEGEAEPEASGQPAPPPAPEIEPFDFGAAVKPLEDTLDLDGAEALASVMTDAQASLQKQVEARVQAQVQPLQQQLAELQVDLTLREMVETFPQLADKTQREAVRAKAAVLYATGGYTEEGPLLDDACKLALDTQADTSASSRTLDLDKKRDGGNLEVPTSQNAAKPMSAEDKSRLAFRKLLKKHA